VTGSRILGVAAVLAGVCACKGDSPVGPGTSLYIVRQPTQGVAGAPLSPGLEVRLEDSSGRGAEGSITVEITSNACGFPLNGVTTVQATDGSATFGNLTLETVAKGYRLTVRSGTLQAATSPFDIAPPTTPTRSLVQEHTLCTKPNPQGDAESIEYVPEDDVFWIADDDSPSIFAVDRLTGAFRTRVTVAQFLAAFPGASACDDGDGDPNTSCSYVNELEHLAYDRLDGSMYVMNTVNSTKVTPVKDRPAMFRLRRGTGCSACWTFDTWKPLAEDAHYESLMSLDGTLYVSVGRNLYQYDFEANQALTTDDQGNPLPPSYTAESGVDRLHYDGTHVWIILRTGVLKQVHWQSRNAVASFDLPAYGVATPAGVELVGGSLYILDGDPPNPILRFEAPSGL
jgi:hypothetical protein